MKPSISVHVIYPIVLFDFFGVGLSSLRLLCMQDAWHIVERRMRSAINEARRCGGCEVH